MGETIQKKMTVRHRYRAEKSIVLAASCEVQMKLQWMGCKPA